MSFALYARNVRDNDFRQETTLPAAAANKNTGSLDLGQATMGSMEEIEFEIAVEALPALVDTKVVTIKVQDSADNVTFADTDPLIRTTLTGAGGAGAAAKTLRFRLPSTTRRYVSLNIAVETGGGDNTAKKVVLSALF